MREVVKGIYWTGFVDWDLRLFHGYSTPEGSTYNAYVILDEAPTIIDSVKEYGYDEMLWRIKEVIDPAKIRYIVSNHTEPDHSGNITRLVKICPQAEVVCSPKGMDGLKRYFKEEWKFKVVADGESLSIGARTLRFFHTPMVHWPDNMVTYCPEEKILFSNDAFGQHLASEYIFADEFASDYIYKAAEKYYANIVLPYGTQVQKALAAVGTLDIGMICPSHGLIWRKKEDIARIVAQYDRWSRYEADNKVLIMYDTMWHSTEIMAHKIREVLEKSGVRVAMFNLSHSHISDVMTEVLESKVIIAGTAILNNRMLPTMAAMLMYLKGLKPKNRHFATFGSYGWAVVGFKEFEDELKEAGLAQCADGVYIRFKPDAAELDTAVAGLPEKVKAVFAAGA
jgi:flavorubredoxin